MMPLIIPKFPPKEKETHAQREIRGFRAQATAAAKRQRREALLAAIQWPWRTLLSLKRKSARAMPRRPKSLKRSVT